LIAFQVLSGGDVIYDDSNEVVIVVMTLDAVDNIMLMGLLNRIGYFNIY